MDSVNAIMTTLRASIACSALAVVATAQESDFIRIAVHVTAVQDTRAYLDVGSDGGLALGDRVELHPDGQPMVEALVRGITRNTARVEWHGAGVLAIGTSGEALVPASRSVGGALGHPPWTQGPEKFDPNQPLLAPVRGLDNWERERDLRGRWFTQADWTSIDVNGSQDYFLARSGLDFSLENPFGQGGALEFDGEIFHRTQSLLDAGDESETRGRLDQLSTWWGGVRGSERRTEVGRFLQHEFPEFGVIDGAEMTWRTDGGDRFGASAGLLPEIDDVRSHGEDLALSAFYRHVVGEDEHAAIGVGVQKTWHGGSSDRDLAVINGHWRSGSRWSLYGSTWIDFYDSEDTTKSAGAELTQAIASVNYRLDSGATLGLHASQFRWPELARDEIPPATAATLSDGAVTRVGVSGSKPVTQKWRIYGRVDRWDDQDDEGGNFEVRNTLRDTLFQRGDVSASVFATQGKFTDLAGLRLGAMRQFDAGNLRVDYEIAQAEQSGFNGSQSTLLQQALRASFDLAFGSSWSFSLSGESRFGDQQDSLYAGFFLQRRF